MNRIRVSSQTIASIGYDIFAGALEMEFHDGTIYQYDDVPQSVYMGLIDADPHDDYFNLNIKDVYPDRKVN